MKRCLLIAIICFVSIATTVAADKVRVSIVKQYTQDSEFILPEKVVEKKMSTELSDTLWEKGHDHI